MQPTFWPVSTTNSLQHITAHNTESQEIHAYHAVLSQLIAAVQAHRVSHFDVRVWSECSVSTVKQRQGFEEWEVLKTAQEPQGAVGGDSGDHCEKYGRQGLQFRAVPLCTSEASETVQSFQRQSDMSENISPPSSGTKKAWEVGELLGLHSSYTALQPRRLYSVKPSEICG